DWRGGGEALGADAGGGKPAGGVGRGGGGGVLWGGGVGSLGGKGAEKRGARQGVCLREEDLEGVFLRRLAGGGSILHETRPAPFYATSSEGLAEDVQLLLLRLGIPSAIHRKSFRYRGISRPGFTVHPMGESGIESFAERVAPHALGREGATQMLLEFLRNSERGRTSKDTVPAEIR